MGATGVLRPEVPSVSPAPGRGRRRAGPRVPLPAWAGPQPASPRVRASRPALPGLMALQSSGVAFRRILSHFPEELSLAFAYGSGVYRQAGPSSDQKVSAGPEPDLPRRGRGSSEPPCAHLSPRRVSRV